MKVSIITINYNNADGLMRTLTSIHNQRCQEYEMVIVDGGSQDASKTVIENYVKKHPETKWVSEKDKGIYNAMNKGTRMSSGDYCIFMNSGDCFDNVDSLTDSIPYLDGETEIISGSARFDKYIREAPNPEELSLTFFIRDAMNHQSTYIKRQLLLTCPYNEKRRIVGDTEFFFQSMILNNATYKKIPVCVSLCEPAGESGDLQCSLKERIVAIKELLPPRMAYDVDFIKKYHNPFVLKIGNIAYNSWIRNIYHLIKK